MRYFCSDHLTPLRQVFDLLQFDHCEALSSRLGLSVLCTALNIPFTHASISHLYLFPFPSLFYCLFGVIIADVVLLLMLFFITCIDYFVPVHIASLFVCQTGSPFSLCLSLILRPLAHTVNLVVQLTCHLNTWDGSVHVVITIKIK